MRTESIEGTPVPNDFAGAATGRGHYTQPRGVEQEYGAACCVVTLGDPPEQAASRRYEKRPAACGYPPSAGLRRFAPRRDKRNRWERIATMYDAQSNEMRTVAGTS